MSFTLLSPVLIAAFSGFTALPGRMISAVTFICNAMGVHANARGNQDSVAPIYALYTRLLGKMKRLNALMLRFKAGHAMQRTQKPRAPAARTRTVRSQATKSLRLPTSHAWLLKLAPCTGQFADFVPPLLDDADLRALAAASLQARRLLRPLWRMMGLVPPALLDLPPRKPGPARPGTPPEPPAIPPIQPPLIQPPLIQPPPIQTGPIQAGPNPRPPIPPAPD